jgi:hypothetical protein
MRYKIHKIITLNRKVYSNNKIQYLNTNNNQYSIEKKSYYSMLIFPW